MGQKSVAWNPDGSIKAFYDDVDSPSPKNVKTINITNAEWQDAINNPGKYLVVNNGFTVTSPWPPNPIQIPLSDQASTAILTANEMAIRCVQLGIAFPADWQTYTTALYAIKNGTSTSKALPVKPANPAGT